MTVERLVQQLGIERTDVFITTEGTENTAGVEEAGSDVEADATGLEARDDAELNGRVVVSVDIEDNDLAEEVCLAFAEFEASDVARD